jgi:Tol biopolymer transport system component
VVHRDLKPANVMIADERVKVLDFGLARGRVVDTPESPGTTRSGGSGPRDWRIEGTLPYMSPEQLAGKPPQRSSDIWSFGCVVYEMLTGQPAFSGVWGEIEHKIRNVSPDWTLLPADTPYGIRRLMELCLNRDVKARLKDIGDARLEIGIVQDREDPLRVLELERDRIKAQAAADAERWGSERDAIRAESARASQAATEARQQNEALRSRLKTMTRREWLGWSAAAVGAASAVTAMRRVAAGTQSFQTLATSHPASIALSPDGTKIVFSAVTADRTQSQLYLIDRNATDPTPIPLPGTFGAVFPFWDPESARVGFGAEGELRWIHINGGAPTTLAEVTGFLGGAWQKDTILFGTDRGPIQSIGASGGKPGPLPGLGEHQISQRFPQFLPDGRYIYYASGPSDAAGVFVDSSNHEMMPLQLLKGSAVEAMPVYTTSQHLLFIKDGALRSLKSALKESLNVDDSTLVNTRPIAIDRSSMAMALSVADDGKRLVYRAAAASSPWQFEWFTSQGNSERSVSIESDAFPVSASLSIDGRVAYSRFVQQDFQIAIRTLDNSGSDVKRREHSDLFPVWSPVGDRLAFSTTQKRPEFDVYVMNLRVNPPTFRKLPLEGPRVSIRPTDWSPDGKHVLYQIVDQEGVTLHAVNVFNVLGNTPFTVRQNASNGQFSPNGQWIAYQSHVSGEPEIYVMRFTGGEPLFGEEPRFIARGFHPRWSKTNETLFFIDPDGALTPVTLPGSAGNNAIGEPRIRPSIFKPPTGGASLTADGPPYMVSKDDRFLIVTPSATAVPLTYLQDWESA